MNPKVRKNQDCIKTYEGMKHLRTYAKPDTLKNFYFDNFNSFKENQYELKKKQTSVSNKIILYLFY